MAGMIGFWDRLGMGEGGLPTHLPMGVDKFGDGPENDDEAEYWRCWCADPECPLTQALSKAVLTGLRCADDGR